MTDSTKKTPEAGTPLQRDASEGQKTHRLHRGMIDDALRARGVEVPRQDPRAEPAEVPAVEPASTPFERIIAMLDQVIVKQEKFEERQKKFEGSLDFINKEVQGKFRHYSQRLRIFEGEKEELEKKFEESSQNILKQTSDHDMEHEAKVAQRIIEQDKKRHTHQQEMEQRFADFTSSLKNELKVEQESRHNAQQEKINEALQTMRAEQAARDKKAREEQEGRDKQLGDALQSIAANFGTVVEGGKAIVGSPITKKLSQVLYAALFVAAGTLGSCYHEYVDRHRASPLPAMPAP